MAKTAKRAEESAAESWQRKTVVARSKFESQCEF